MALPITVPYTFGNATTAIPLSNLDSDYATVYQAVNGIGNGSVALANVTITGGTVSNVSGVVPTPFIANGVVYASSTSALATGSGITYNGTTFSTTNDASISGLTVGKGAGSQVESTVLGSSSLGGSNTGSQNTAIGYSILNANTSGNGNTGIGSYALRYNTTGYNNFAGGVQALQANTTGYTNTAIGFQSLISNTTASNNTAVGYQAGYSNTTGASNAFFGLSAGYANTIGQDCTFLGFQCGYANTTGNQNTAVGGHRAGAQGAALSSNSTGSDNVAVGTASLASATGSQNTAIGSASGYSATTGSSNVFVGWATTLSAVTDSNEIVIGASAVGKGSNTGFISPNGGGVYQGNASTLWSTTSDQRIKKNIVDNTIGLSAINGIRIRNFEYRLPEEIDPTLKPTDAVNIAGVRLGVIAQELQEVLPDCVITESTGVMAVNADNIMWHMINAIKELNAEIQALKSKVGI